MPAGSVEAIRAPASVSPFDARRRTIYARTPRVAASAGRDRAGRSPPLANQPVFAQLLGDRRSDLRERFAS